MKESLIKITIGAVTCSTIILVLGVLFYFFEKYTGVVIIFTGLILWLFYHVGEIIIELYKE